MHVYEATFQNKEDYMQYHNRRGVLSVLQGCFFKNFLKIVIIFLDVKTVCSFRK